MLVIAHAMPDNAADHVPALLLRAAHSVCEVLTDILPKLSPSWWPDLVVANLSYQQQRAVDVRKLSALSHLDLAALLRIFDANWNAITEHLRLPIEVRHFLKETRTVRDRWAHAAPTQKSQDDVYRDLDTVQRFLTAIRTDDPLIAEIKRLKQLTFPRELRPTPAPSAANAHFTVGQLVALKSNPDMTGAVIAINESGPERRYSVFQNGSLVTYYEGQLCPANTTGELRHVPLDEFAAYISALQIRHPSTSVVYSLHAARIDCVPYQFRPVLRFIRAERPRLLIADGVGVGKTIEAGLILKELQARMDLQRVLIICPKPLVTERKWELEMRRFDERFLPLDGSKLAYCINEVLLDGEWPEQYAKSILPYSILDEEILLGSPDDSRRRRKGLIDLTTFPRFDLVIVDEAQHVRNPETNAHKCVRFFCENANAAVFLTATPLEMGTNDLYVLLNLLRPDLVRDAHTFEIMIAPNPSINAAAALARAGQPNWQEEAREQLERAANTMWGSRTIRGDPAYTALVEMLLKPSLSQSERVTCVQEIEQLHTLSGILNRTRRRDIGDFTIRKPDTITVPFTEQQRKLHDDVLMTQALILTTLHPSVNVKFLMTMIRRQAASCLYGLGPLLREILTRRLSELSSVEADVPDMDPTVGLEGIIKTKVEDILAQAAALDPRDPKLDALKQIVREKVAMPNHRLMVFSSFRHTLSYLFTALAADGIRVGLVNGDTPDEERITMRQRFQMEREQPDAIHVLLFSEVGSEGLDYQFCDAIVNYDLPWNPMRIEQRIGRIDRRGQRSEKIRIMNIITPGTVDADIYERCLERIGIFDREIGASDEILGALTRELRSIAEDLTLSDDDRRTKLQQLADNQVRLIRQQQELEDRQSEFFALRMPLRVSEQELQDASSQWLTPALLENLVHQYLGKIAGKEQDSLLGDKTAKTLRLNQDSRNLLLAHFEKLAHANALTYREWDAWLKGTNPHLRVTFDPTAATPDTSLLSPVHPLVKQAANSFVTKERFSTACQATSDVVPSGDYPFAIYQWQFLGLQEDLQLVPVTMNNGLRAHFFALLKHATSLDGAAVSPAAAADELEREHYRLWCDAREKHRSETAKRGAFRLASLESSYAARRSLLEDQLANATEDRIRRMHKAQIDRAEAEHARRVHEVNQALQATDVQAQLVALGVLRVHPSWAKDA